MSIPAVTTYLESPLTLEDRLIDFRKDVQTYIPEVLIPYRMNLILTSDIITAQFDYDTPEKLQKKFEFTDLDVKYYSGRSTGRLLRLDKPWNATNIDELLECLDTMIQAIKRIKSKEKLEVMWKTYDFAIKLIFLLQEQINKDRLHIQKALNEINRK